MSSVEVYDRLPVKFLTARSQHDTHAVNTLAEALIFNKAVSIGIRAKRKCPVQRGAMGWTVKMGQLLDRTTSLCGALDEMGIRYYRNPYLNIIAIRAEYVDPQIAKAFTLVPDDHDKPAWYKIVMMPHVKQGAIDEFISRLKNSATYTRN